MAATVSISELKARLSEHIRRVKRGGEVLILDRGTPVARLVGLTGEGAPIDRRLSLIRAGVLRPGDGDVSAVLASPPLDLPVRLSEALDEDRADRR
jgi:prevent-host-death family protein